MHETALPVLLGISLMAQDPTPGWHRFGERNDAPPPAQQPEPQRFQQQPMQAPLQSYSPQGPVDLTLAPGSWITARVNEPLSSNYAQSGDSFTATLAQPLIANGLVIARTGQLVYGRVVNVSRAGRVKGTSSMVVELTELGLVDGQQVPLKTQLIERRGDSSVGNDVAAVGITSGLGAAIGAAAGGGWGAGIGALAGAALGTTGVLATRGRDTVLFPEQVLTFRLEAPVHVYSQSANAFQPGTPFDYNHNQVARAPMPRQGYGAGYPYIAPYPYFGGSFYSGPGFFYGRGYGRRW